jgi:hypothetical protein
VRVRIGVAAVLVLALVATSITYGREEIQIFFDPTIPETPPSQALSATPSPDKAPAEELGAAAGSAPTGAGDESGRAAKGDGSLQEGGARGDLVGDFCYPDDVPYYGLSSKREAGNDLIRVLEATVRTRATSETDLTLITRAFKAFYADHDALVLSFESLPQKEGAAIGEAYVTNTAAGAFILGMSGGPLNEEGISVVSYVDPATIPQAEVFATTECS